MNPNITYENNSNEAIAIPAKGDTAEEWTSTCKKVKALIEDNKSLAFFSQEAFISTDKATSIEANALANMTHNQSLAYKSWKDGEYTVDGWDFSAHPLPPLDLSNFTSKLWTSKALALERIFKDEDAISTSQAKAWVHSNPKMHPLWKALVILVRSERAACGGKSGKDPKKFIEAVACRKFMRRLKYHSVGLKEQNPDAPELALYAEVKELLQNRVDSIDGAEN